jgi:hypothetical protein
MKHLRVVSALFVLMLGVTFVSCDSENPPTDGSVLNLAPETLTFAKGDTSSATTLGLSCGCGFTVAVTSIETDTSNIGRLIAVDSNGMANILPVHNIQFADTSSRATTAASFTVSLTATKKDYTYTKKVIVNVTQ